MNSVLRTLFKSAIGAQKDTAFKDIVDSIYAKKFGPHFSSVKAKRDKGCDGIVENKKILAAYSPERPNLKDFKKKSTDDYSKYTSNWHTTHPEWEYVYNGEYTASMIQHLDSLMRDCCKVDIKQLLNMIDELPHFAKRDLAIELSIDEQLIIYDVLRNVIEDLFKRSEQCIGPVRSHYAPPYIEDKIRLNYDKKDIENALKEYECVMEYFGTLKDILKSYHDYEISALKTKLIDCYSMLSGNFQKRFATLVIQFSDHNKGDDCYIFSVKVVLTYFFEICVIGKKPASEK